MAAHILVADDDEDLRELLVVCLALDGHHIEEVSTGLELAARIRDPDGLDLVITDVRMPGMTGIDVLAAMRGSATAQHVPVILMTAFGDEETYEVAQRFGAEVMTKPFELETLRACVLNMLAKERS
jgi:DNA-binding NtrC family response regulator